MYIRHFKGEEDLDIVLELENICFSDTAWGKEEYSELIDDPDLIFILIFDNVKENQLIAACFGFTNQGDEMWFNSNAVHPDYRRMGLGSLMIKLRETAGRIAKDQRILVEMSVNNKASIAMHKKAGFKPNGNIIDNYYPNGDDALQMEKKLC